MIVLPRRSTAPAGEIHTHTGAPARDFRGGTIQHPVQCNQIDIEDEGLRSECLVYLVRAQQNGQSRDHRNFADWCYANFGDRITEVFQRPYIRKYWTVEMEQLSTDWIGPRVYAPDVDQVVDGAIGIRGLTSITQITSATLRKVDLRRSPKTFEL